MGVEHGSSDACAQIFKLSIEIDSYNNWTMCNKLLKLRCNPESNCLETSFFTCWNFCMQAEIIKDPASYVERDPDMARTLLDQREAVHFFNDDCHYHTSPQLSILFALISTKTVANLILDYGRYMLN